MYSALIGYIWYEAPDEEMNFTTLLEMINASEAREDDPEFQSPVDQTFERLEAKDPDHFAVRQYKKFLLSAGKTRSSILISCGARLDKPVRHGGLLCPGMRAYIKTQQNNAAVSQKGQRHCFLVFSIYKIM